MAMSTSRALVLASQPESKCNASITFDRRAALMTVAKAMAVGAAAGATLAIADGASRPAGAAGAPDPIFALIDEHKAAEAAFGAALNVVSKLEAELPKSARQSEDRIVVKTDDPRWIAGLREADACSDATDDFAISLIATPPTTMAGVVALLRYAVAYEVEGKEWPGGLFPGGGDGITDAWSQKWGRDWRFYLSNSLAGAIDKIAVAS